MPERTGIPDLCPDCQLRKSEKAAVATKEDKNDFWARVSEALRKAEQCRYFYHHTLFDAEGREEEASLVGTRTCSFAIRAGCGHELLKYGQCWDWRDGRVCPDWQAKGER